MEQVMETMDKVMSGVTGISGNVVHLFNPSDVKSLAMAVYIKHGGGVVKDITGNNINIFATGADIVYLGFDPKIHIGNNRMVRKAIRPSNKNLHPYEMNVDDPVITRVIYSLHKFNDHGCELEVLEFVHSNIDSILRWLHCDEKLTVSSDKTDYLKYVKELKPKIPSYMELQETFTVTNNKAAVNRCHDIKEVIVMNRLAKLAGYTLWYEQCTSLGVMIYS